MRWPDRFVHDELWLRARRALLSRLPLIGPDRSWEEYQRFAGEQHAVGTALLAKLEGWIGPDRAAELAHETFLGAAHRRFWLRLPFILAFMAEYARWLARLAPACPGRERLSPELAALFNLGIVLVDQITDAPERRGEVAEVFGGSRLKRLISEPSAARELLDRAATFRTPELRVLAAIVGGFFRGAAVMIDNGTGPAWRSRFGEAILMAAEAQVAVVGGARDEPTLRRKSMTPFVIPPALTFLAADADSTSQARLLELGGCIGDVFWRVDDLLDVARDFASDEGNIVLARTQNSIKCSEDALIAILESGIVETIAEEAAAHAKAALRLIDGDVDVRRDAARWLELYVVDWMR